MNIVSQMNLSFEDVRNVYGPRVAEIMQVPLSQLQVVALPTYHMYTKFRDTPIKRYGLTADMPQMVLKSLHSASLPGLGITHFRCRGQPSLTYVTVVVKSDSGFGYSYFYFTKKGEAFRIVRNCNRLARLSVQKNKPPVIEESILKDIQDSVIGFLSFEKVIAAYDVTMNRGIILDGPPGNGKAQPLDSLVYTPNGPVKMGEISIGMQVCTPDGLTAKVVGVFPQGVKDVYRVHFNNGDYAECCAEHLWPIRNRQGGEKIVNTKYLIEHYRTASGCYPLRLRVASPLQFTERLVAIDPYVMGVLLGDGCFRTNGLRLSSVDGELVESVAERLPASLEISEVKGTSCDYIIASREPRYNKYRDALRSYGLNELKSVDKFIPFDYLYNSESARWSLLQGLMDTDGGIEGWPKQSQAVFYTSSPHLADDLKILVQSLGGMVRTSVKENPVYEHLGERRVGQKTYRLCIQLADPTVAFSLDRKKKRCIARSKYGVTRVVKNVELIGQKECQCILIDHPDHLYITDNFIVTHNTMLCRYIQRLCHDNNFTSSSVTATEIDKAFKENTLSSLFQQSQVTFFDDIDIAYFSRSHGDGKMACSLLTAMDGMSQGSRLSVRIFTTNEQIETLDPAFVRPGRIDRRITIGKPGAKLRRQIVGRWKSDIRENIDQDRLVSESEGWSGAQLESVKGFLVEGYFNGHGWQLERALKLAAGKSLNDTRKPVGFIAESVVTNQAEAVGA